MHFTEYGLKTLQKLERRNACFASMVINMKKAALTLSIVAVSISVLTMALVVLELLFRKTSYIERDDI